MPHSPLPVERPILPRSKKEHTPGVRPLGHDGRPHDAPMTGGVRLEESITIARPAADIYSFWRNFMNLPRFCRRLDKVELLQEGRSRWTVNGPGNKPLTWEATIIDDRPNELISWRSFEDADFMNAGSVRFQAAPADRGTEVHITFAYNPPGGPLGAAIAKLTARDPAVLLRQQLIRLKQLLETGEIATIDGQPVVVGDGKEA